MIGKKVTPKKAVTPQKRERSDAELERMERAAKRELTRLTPVAVAWSSDGRLDAQHHDLTGAMVALSDALGTTSDDFRDVQLGMLDYASRERGEARGKSAAALNASLALVEAIAPQNELEAALAVQMSGVHNLTGELLGRAKQTDRTDYIALYGGLAVKLARTFTAQVEALAKLRGGGKQQVEVRHVYVNGNAVIGDVHAGGGGGAGNERQPHAPALSHAPGETLPGALAAEREAVPSAGREGPDAL